MESPTHLTLSIAEKRDLGVTFHVLVLAYLRALAVDNKVTVKNTDIAKYFDVTTRYSTEAITALRQKGYVAGFTYDGRTRTIVLA
jgi:DNA-binding MarR family transcriptional regulator